MKHRNDIYGDDISTREGGTPAIPAATVVLVRAAPEPEPQPQPTPVSEPEPELEVLMLHKTSQIAFGGMWVFPGGRIDPGDYPEDGDILHAARNAAVRETCEEAGLVVHADEFVWFAHWTPPPSTPKRFATWFFVARADSHDVCIDGGEIQAHQWLSPARALASHAAGEIDLAPPTWITLHHLSLYPTIDGLVDRLRATEPRYYATHLAKLPDGTRVAMWEGDAGYETWDAGCEGERHRLVMTPGGFVFENTVQDY